MRRPFIKKKATLIEIMDQWNMRDLYDANIAISFEESLELEAYADIKKENK